MGAIEDKYRKKLGLAGPQEDGPSSGTVEDRMRERMAARQAQASAVEEEDAAREAELAEISGMESFGEGALQGATLGWADEARGKVGQWLDDLSGLGEEQAALLGEEYDSEANYKGLRDAKRAELEKAKLANPGAFLGGEIAGGIASPVNFLGGGAASVGRVAGRAALEGGLSGAGYAEGEYEGGDDTLENALTGAVLGGAIGGGLSKAMRGISNRRISQDLVQPDGTQMPLQLVDEDSALPGFYQQFVGRTVGGQRALKNQQRPFIDAAEDAAKNAKLAQQQNKTLRQMEVSEALAQRKSQEAARLQKAVDDLDARAWQQTLDEAIPPTMPREIADEVRNAPSRIDGQEMLADWYANNAFKAMDSYTGIKMPNNFVTQVKQLVGRNPEFKDKLGKGMWKELQRAVDNPDGLTGAQFMELRNVFARAANGTPSLKGKTARAVADKFDNLSKRMMGGEKSADWVSHRAELDAWGPMVSARGAADAAEKQGRDLGAKDLVTKTRKGTGLRKATSKAVQEQNAAKEGAKLNKATREQITEELNVSERAYADDQMVDEVLEELSRLKTAASPEKPTGLSEILATKLFGAGNLLTGTAIAKTLAHPATQRALAGQTEVQAQIRRLVEQGLIDEANVLLSRALTTQAAGAM